MNNIGRVRFKKGVMDFNLGDFDLGGLTGTIYDIHGGTVEVEFDEESKAKLPRERLHELGYSADTLYGATWDELEEVEDA